MNNVETISFRIYADSREEADNLEKAIAKFIDWFGQRGVKVEAKTITGLMDGWDKNLIVRNTVIQKICNGKN